jgi:hypothetical protein
MDSIHDRVLVVKNLLDEQRSHRRSFAWTEPHVFPKDLEQAIPTTTDLNQGTQFSLADVSLNHDAISGAV